MSDIQKEVDSLITGGMRAIEVSTRLDIPLTDVRLYRKREIQTRSHKLNLDEHEYLGTYHEMTLNEIAEELGIRIIEVREVLTSALSKMREPLSGYRFD